VRAAALALAALALSGCTTIARVNVYTIAANCDVLRGSDTAINAAATGSTLSGNLDGAGQLAKMLQSKVLCRDAAAP